MNDLILFGMQGSGKGTQGKLIAERFPYMVFEAGAELRRLAHTDSALGKKVKDIIDAGNLVPDEVIMEIVESYIAVVSKDQKVIFDGIPRNISQAKLFSELMERVERDPHGLYITLTEKTALARLTTRRICSQCKKVFPVSYTSESCDACGAVLARRADDTPESIRVRLENFKKETVPVIELFRTHGRLIEIDGDRSTEEVARDIAQKIESIDITL